MKNTANNYSSSLIGRVHKMLLGISIVPLTIIMVLTVFYVVDYELYINHLYTLDLILDSFSTLLYYVILVTFLLWITRVHAALRQRFPDYPISTFDGLCRMIPIIFIWGLYNTFNRISQFLLRSEASERTGSTLKIMIVPLYFVYLITYYFNQQLNTNPTQLSDYVMMTSVIFDVVSTIVFFYMTILVQRGIAQIQLVAVADDIQHANQPFHDQQATVNTFNT